MTGVTDVTESAHSIYFEQGPRFWSRIAIFGPNRAYNFETAYRSDLRYRRRVTFAIDAE